MSFAYLPLFTGDYLRDTRHLTPLKHGIYLLFLMHCWDQKGPLPLDEQECAGIANCRSADEIEALRYILNRYFVRCDDGWYNERIQREIERSENISRARSAAGREGYQARAKQLLSKSQASASIPIPIPKPSLTPKPKPVTHGVEDLAFGSISTVVRKTSVELEKPELSAGVVAIPLVDKTEFQVTQAMIDEFSELYPAVDVKQTLNEIRGWNLTHPTQRKTRTGILKHINTWLAKEQNRG